MARGGLWSKGEGLFTMRISFESKRHQINTESMEYDCVAYVSLWVCTYAYMVANDTEEYDCNVL